MMNSVGKIAVIGVGYVGLIQAVGLAKDGHDIVCIDIDEAKIEKLNAGAPPIYEEGLSELLEDVLQTGKIKFSSAIVDAKECQTFFVAVGTPTNELTGNANLEYLFSAVSDIMKVAPANAVIVVKSTVPIGTCERLQNWLDTEEPTKQMHVVSNPEFLREGRALADFFNPERIVIGARSDIAVQRLFEIYRSFESKGVPILASDWFSSETIKYAANAFLAMKVTFINEIANLTQTVGGDIETVARGIGLDSRIGSQFLKVGPGYGGSCFPKDTLALATMARRHGVQQQILEAVIAVNDNRRYMILRQIEDILGSDLSKCRIAVLGIAFKANTDDIRDSSAVAIIHTLLDENAEVSAYDPMASFYTDHRKFRRAKSVDEAVTDADLILIVTEWDEFKTHDYNAVLPKVKKPNLFDLRLLLTERREELKDWNLHFIGQK